MEASQEDSAEHEKVSGLGMRPRRTLFAPMLPGVRISGERGQKGMIGVDKIEDIRRRARAGEPIASIARHVVVSETTVRKYARMVDLSPEPPSVRQPESEVLAPYEGTIDSWLDDDCRNWRKQRYTATRVYVRLRDEFGYGGSYSTVQRYMKRWPRSAAAGTPRATCTELAGRRDPGRLR